MSKKDFKIGQRVYLKGIKKYGVVISLDSDGHPEKVDVGGKVIYALSYLIEGISLFKEIWLLLKGVFNSNK